MGIYKRLPPISHRIAHVGKFGSRGEKLAWTTEGGLGRLVGMKGYQKSITWMPQSGIPLITTTKM